MLKGATRGRGRAEGPAGPRRRQRGLRGGINRGYQFLCIFVFLKFPQNCKKQAFATKQTRPKLFIELRAIEQHISPCGEECKTVQIVCKTPASVGWAGLGRGLNCRWNDCAEISPAPAPAPRSAELRMQPVTGHCQARLMFWPQPRPSAPWLVCVCVCQGMTGSLMWCLCGGIWSDFVWVMLCQFLLSVGPVRIWTLDGSVQVYSAVYSRTEHSTEWSAALQP